MHIHSGCTKCAFHYTQAMRACLRSKEQPGSSHCPELITVQQPQMSVPTVIPLCDLMQDSSNCINVLKSTLEIRTATGWVCMQVWKCSIGPGMLLPFRCALPQYRLSDCRLAWPANAPAPAVAMCVCRHPVILLAHRGQLLKPPVFAPAQKLHC